MNRTSLLFGSALVAASLLGPACATAPDELEGDSVRLDWSVGDVWYVAASTRQAANMGEELPTDLETGEPMVGPSGERVAGEVWSQDVVWTYQVVEAGYRPAEDDELFAYAEKRGEAMPLAVIKASVDPALNSDADAEGEPVVYLVFREDTDRLAAIIEFRTVDGERVERAVSTTELGRSWSVLSQSNLSPAPAFLAPSAARWEDGRITLEHGRSIELDRVGDDELDVVYDDELGGGMVISRYEAGAPWPTWTVTDNLDARLLSSREVAELQSFAPPMAPTPPEDFDYRGALRASVDIDAALSLSADDIDAEGWEAEAFEGYRPWAGNWWPLKSGELVWGYDGRDTYSQRIKAEVDPIKRDMDGLSKELRDLDDDAPERDGKVTEFQDKQKQLVDILVAFYGGLQTDLDSGLVTIGDGELRHSGGGEIGGDGGWAYDLDELSPMDKAALAFYADQLVSGNAFYLPAWEILNSYNPDGEGWWGHCNGWSAAAILTNEPTQSVSVDVRGQAVSFSTADLKGLLTESHYSTSSHFYGQRYNGADDDVTDLSPAAFQRLVSFYMREQGVGLVFDTTATEQVWNFPAWGVDLVIEETTQSGALDLVNINTADEETLDELPGIGEALSEGIVDYRENNGPFQDVADVMNVSGIGEGTFEGIEDLITVDVLKRTFDVVAQVTLTTDAVDVDWVDSGDPESFTETWGYSLTTDETGTVLDGKWDDEEEHPDFAWVPYSNPHSAQSGGSENPYLPYGSLLDVIGEDFERK